MMAAGGRDLQRALGALLALDIGEIERWEGVGIDGINFMLNAMEEVPQAEVLASMRLFAAEVMPKFRP